MKSQIIKEYVPFFIDFLTQNAKTESNYVLFNEELFRNVNMSVLILNF